jgi:hypothetical protein
MLDKLELLIKLIKENPDLPVIFYSDLEDSRFILIEKIQIKDYVKKDGYLYLCPERIKQFPQSEIKKCIAVWIE